MSELISGKEAKLAWANDKEVEYYSNDLGKWFSLKDNVFLSDVFDKNKLRLKPRTIKINGVEVPAPFEPKEDCNVWIISDKVPKGYSVYDFEVNEDYSFEWFGLWRTEEEIKQVVSALRSVFKGGVR